MHIDNKKKASKIVTYKYMHFRYTVLILESWEFKRMSVWLYLFMKFENVITCIAIYVFPNLGEFKHNMYSLGIERWYLMSQIRTKPREKTASP